MFWNILDKDRILLLKEIISKVDLEDFYLAGGTGLSLQLGLRKSEDFDFFIPHKFSTDSFSKNFGEIFQEDLQEAQVVPNDTYDIVIRGIQVSFFWYPYKVLSEFVCPPDLPGLKIAGIPDIAAMKALAIGGRGTKKDFFDLYQIFKLTDYDIHKLVDDIIHKYGNRPNFTYVGMGLNYFEDAEDEKLQQTFVPYDWNEIKRFFSSIQSDFFHDLDAFYP